MAHATSHPTRSPQPSNLGLGFAERSRYTPMRVMRSEAGYYVGTAYVDDDGSEVPGTRDSGYFATADQAARELAAYGDDEPTARPFP